jgi:hypothetical protein
VGPKAVLVVTIGNEVITAIIRYSSALVLVAGENYQVRC